MVEIIIKDCISEVSRIEWFFNFDCFEGYVLWWIVVNYVCYFFFLMD